MASYFRPLRGTRASALEQLDGNAPLKNGEVFFEYPDGGPGSGPGKIKMGDANGTPYSDLPYFIDPENIDRSNITGSKIKASSIDESKILFVNPASGDTQDDSVHLAKISPTETTNTVFNRLKTLLINFSNRFKKLQKEKCDIETSGKDSGSKGYAKGISLGTNNTIDWDNSGDDPFPDYISSRPTSYIDLNGSLNNLPTAGAVCEYIRKHIVKGVVSVDNLPEADNEFWYKITLEDIIKNTTSEIDPNSDIIGVCTCSDYEGSYYDKIF